MTGPRDYNAIAARIRALPSSRCTVDLAATVRGHPLYVLRSPPSPSRGPRLALSAGTHGDEPAGVEAVVRLLETGDSTLAGFDWVAFPCLNPAGYAEGTRENGAGVDINRSFENEEVAEALAVKRVLRGAAFDVFIECHEDWEASAFYMFECGDAAGALGGRVMAEVARECPVSHASDIDGMRAVDGVIQVDEEFAEYGHRSLALYMWRFHAKRVLTCEAPGSLPFEQCVTAHMAAIRSALANAGL
ncbi:M14 family metallocarboxypeptidase [Candidatus Poribacteria bacterium]|jgi:murein peptide amidase A|nr:M14 family metallocarboxypeptidase [Candidatus Poribacteria bacterium]MBT5712648.1 M14 family metallocarboxypeptidase [Candidatus Poribacteria bacterium]MBT7100045.1 M14 family metallocarboxypeptidase [Candidatus Poribacteria bacterium]MBT7807036.1 M14 family metallocarboxypeptidase [Candidatus Poribacteria bacterium]